MFVSCFLVVLGGCGGVLGVWIVFGCLVWVWVLGYGVVVVCVVYVVVFGCCCCCFVGVGVVSGCLGVVCIWWGLCFCFWVRLYLCGGSCVYVLGVVGVDGCGL